MLSIASTSLADVALADTDSLGFRRFIRRTPLGVVLVIAPWKCGEHVHHPATSANF
jgi:acyl-CoA reductase-like NAD-dependent aldehyde dehydrogenase